MRYLSLFSGIEAASVAWGPLGWEPVAFCEIEPFPSAVLARRFPDVPNLGDITKVDWDEFKETYGAVDVVVGGSPCQSFSIAGNREGLEGASGLMWEYVRAVRDLLPRYCLWENVPGCLSSGPGKGASGEDFGCLLRALDDLGYGIAWRVLDAQFFGVAQRRRRVFLVGSLGAGGAGRACSVLFEPESLSWDFKTGRAERERLAADAGKGAAEAGGAVTFAQNQRDEVRLMEVPGAIAANQGTHQTANVVQPLYAVRTGQTGANGIGVQEGASHTLDCAGPEAVAYGFKFHQGSGARTLGFDEEQSPTLIADWHNPAVMQGQNVVCMTDTQANTAIDEDVGGVLTAHSAKDAPVVAIQTEETCSPPSTPRTGTSSS